MNNNDKIKKIIESEEVPERLRPENIKNIIDSRSCLKKSSKKFKYRSQNRILSGIVACALLSTIGIYIMDVTKIKKIDDCYSEIVESEISIEKTGQKEENQDYISLKNPESYDDLYKYFISSGNLEYDYDINLSDASPDVDIKNDNFYDSQQRIESHMQDDNKEDESTSEGIEYATAFSEYVSNPQIEFKISEDCMNIESRLHEDEEWNDEYISISGIFETSYLQDYEILSINGIAFVNNNEVFIIGMNCMKDGKVYTVLVPYKMLYYDNSVQTEMLDIYSQSGDFIYSKLEYDCVYIVTSDMNYSRSYNYDEQDNGVPVSPYSYEQDKYIPSYYAGFANKNFVSPENIYIDDNLAAYEPSYINVGCIKIDDDLKKENKVNAEMKSFMFPASVSLIGDNFYMAIQQNNETYKTDITKCELKNGEINFKFSKTIDGFLYSEIAEYNNDYIRIAVVNAKDNSGIAYYICIMDKDLNILKTVDIKLNEIQYIEFQDDWCVIVDSEEKESRIYAGY